MIRNYLFKNSIFILVLNILALSQLQAQYNCQATHLRQAQKAMVPSIHNNAKSDTFNILHYQIDLDLTDIPAGNISARAQLKIMPQMASVRRLNLDLHGLQVDSLRLRKMNDTAYQRLTAFSYVDSLLAVDLPQGLQKSDTVWLRIYYHGQPQTDVTGWGGVHRSQGYYYNLGVGFGANPHTFGRAWFPCYDNFVEKSTYHLRVKSKLPLRPLLSGGQQTEQKLMGDTILTEAKLMQPVPTYLVSFALSNYQFLKDTVQARQGVLPILLAAKAADTANLKASFVNLKPTLKAFEHYFGPYRWPRIGYAATTVGAMEHATSISYPLSLINGNLGGESIMAHELAHHWWGNLVTCQTADDMWINEGMAEYCSHLYQEQVYSRERYLKAVRENAYNVLQIAHSRDNGYRSLVGMPHELVYGFHTYQKGAMVAHNLRHYLGDSLFFNGLQSLLQQNANGNLSTGAFRDSLINITGYNGLNDFFQNWISKPGFPQFSVDSLHYNAGRGGAYVELQQRLYEAPALYTKAPVDVTFFDSTGAQTTRRLMHSGALSQHSRISLPFKPQYALANYSGSLLTASVFDRHKVIAPQAFSAEYAGWSGKVNQYSDSGEVIIAQHLVAPGGRSDLQYRSSRRRYFTIQKTGLQGTVLTATLRFDGSSRGWDKDLLLHGNDSLTLLYRPYGKAPWRIYPHQVKKAGNSSSTVGDIEISPVFSGDYVLANTAGGVGLPESFKRKPGFALYPNPSKGTYVISLAEYEESKVYQFKLYSATGALLQAQKLQSDTLRLSMDGRSSGTYYISINGAVQSLVLE